MSLYGISGFLGKFSRLLRSEAAQREVIQEVIKQRFGTLVDKKCIVIKDCVVTLSVHPALKQRIYIEKAKLLEEISLNLPAGAIKDIR